MVDGYLSKSWLLYSAGVIQLKQIRDHRKVCIFLLQVLSLLIYSNKGYRSYIVIILLWNCSQCLDPFNAPKCEAFDIFVNDVQCVGKGKSLFFLLVYYLFLMFFKGMKSVWEFEILWTKFVIGKMMDWNSVTLLCCFLFGFGNL